MRKTAETLQVQTDRRRITFEKNAQRTDIDETMGVGEVMTTKRVNLKTKMTMGRGLTPSGLPGNRSETKRRNQRSFYFRTGTVMSTTSHNGREDTVQCQVGGCPLSKGKPSFKLTCKANRCPTTQTL